MHTSLNTMSRASLLASLATLTVLSACTPARRIDSRGNEVITSTNKVDIQDFNLAADKLVQSMSESGIFAKSAHQPSILGISRITNDTSDQFDTDELIKKIRIALLQTGKVQVSTTEGLNGKPEDPMAKGTKDMREFQSGKSNEMPRLTDYTLTAKILENSVAEGNTKQTSFIFQMSLTDTNSGLAVWEGEETVTKQGQRNAIGF
ncbi:MAG: penicillin-binding protein activator LpoB [Planctomycetes bacterium]|nr:penicillin-binding protein activator LpoB [Planctomycetota bacterium]